MAAAPGRATMGTPVNAEKMDTDRRLRTGTPDHRVFSMVLFQNVA